MYDGHELWLSALKARSERMARRRGRANLFERWLFRPVDDRASQDQCGQLVESPLNRLIRSSGSHAI
jgi:hypothetical protein